MVLSLQSILQKWIENNEYSLLLTMLVNTFYKDTLVISLQFNQAMELLGLKFF